MSYFADDLSMNTNFLQELLLSVFRKTRKLVKKSSIFKIKRFGIQELSESMMSQKGESSGIMMAKEIIDTYQLLDPKSKLEFFVELAEKFGPSKKKLEVAAEAYLNEPNVQQAMALQIAAEPRRQELIRRLNLAPGSTKELVRMRVDLLELIQDHPELTCVDHDFHHLFNSWFNRGFLVLKKIGWDTPASILEKIIEYEAVHKIKSWDDLRSRIEPPDRFCFAFFHPALIDEPLIFVEVALESSIPSSIQSLLEKNRIPIIPERANTAIFYSISNCQKGLRGVTFGNFLIKQVVEELIQDLPQLKTFVTLSPIPGFRNWLGKEIDNDILPLKKLNIKVLGQLENPEWYKLNQKSQELKKVLLQLASEYLFNVRRKNHEPVDPVARFHLGNGARLERINWLGDISKTGIEQSAGMMVNYLYDLDQIEKNHEAFINDKKVIASNEIRKLANRKLLQKVA